MARVVVSTHGAAFCALGDTGLVLPPIDYEWDGYGDHRADFEAALDPFGHTGSPRLPMGLNAGLQLHWVKAARPPTGRASATGCPTRSTGRGG